MKIEKFEKLVTNLHDNIEYVMRIRNLKHPWNHRLVLKKVQRVINLIKILGWLAKTICEHRSKKKSRK